MDFPVEARGRFVCAPAAGGRRAAGEGGPRFRGSRSTTPGVPAVRSMEIYAKVSSAATRDALKRLGESLDGS
ncbi:hypothetical protein Pme01_50530 [Planosporangium mesophilum]|uniref:Uncharacterized protein n=1 Tax=Planosporangium mesophilum TaxID=689768 RepID=A0A8J3TH21_9ACTN|nr:hypothetical protein Pme01_50530 [Planosporangium mesophilum]